MLIVNTDFVEGKKISETLGVVKGEIVQSKNIGRDILAGLKTIVGGEIATKRMIKEAEKLGADAVINVRYGSSTVLQGCAEIIAYGTAVKFK